jgi:hypothetical protein
LARNIGYDKSNSGLLATTVQEALDEVQKIVSAPPQLDAVAVKFSPTGNSLTTQNVQAAIVELNAKYDAHENNKPGDIAHHARYIQATIPTGTAWTFNNVDDGLAALVAALDAHTGKATGAHAASSVSFDSSQMPAGSSVAASDMQTAMEQLASDITTDIDGGTF